MPAPLLSLAENTALLALAAAGTEAQRMVTEKVSAFAEAAALLASGGSAHEVVKGYRAGQAPDAVAVVNGSVNVLEVSAGCCAPKRRKSDGRVSGGFRGRRRPRWGGRNGAVLRFRCHRGLASITFIPEANPGSKAIVETRQKRQIRARFRRK